MSGELVKLSELETLKQERDELLKRISDLEWQNKDISYVTELFRKRLDLGEPYLKRLKIQLEELKTATQLYELALKASWPQGAEGDAFQYWNDARIAAGIGAEE